MPLLKNATIKTVIFVHHNDVEQLIKEVYGHEYEIMPMEEVGSSQYAATYEQTVESGELEPWQLEEIDSLKQGDPKQFILGTILQDLCNNGHITAGYYSISVTR